MLRKKGWTTSSHAEKSSNDGMKFDSRSPRAKFVTVFVSTPNVSVFASMKHMIAEANITMPPIEVADCDTENIANMTAPKKRLVLNLNGKAKARKKSETP